MALKEEKLSYEESLEIKSQSLMAQRKELDSYEVGFVLISAPNLHFQFCIIMYLPPFLCTECSVGPASRN